MTAFVEHLLAIHCAAVDDRKGWVGLCRSPASIQERCSGSIRILLFNARSAVWLGELDSRPVMLVGLVLRGNDGSPVFVQCTVVARPGEGHCGDYEAHSFICWQ